jgi:apolipoprotein N-acyltransferase
MSWGWNQHVHHELLMRLRAVETDRWLVRAVSSGRSEAISPRGVPSFKGVEIGETGTVLVPYAHRETQTWGARAYILGPAAALGTLVFLAFHGLRAWRKRKTKPDPPPATSP